MKNFQNLKFPILIVIAVVFLRLMPHLPNFTPIGALGIFGGAYLGKRKSILCLLAAMLISDYLILYINPHLPNPFNFTHLYSPLALFHSTTIYVYAGLMINVFIGWGVGKNRSAKNIIAASMAASIQFFLITNFGVWASGYYPHNLSGLTESYIMGLPFFRYTLLGDLFYSGLLFGSYTLVTNFKVQTHKFLLSRNDIGKKSC